MKYVLSLSYGKDSLACLGAIEKLGLPLDRIIHVEVWATDTIPADLPPMVEFKKKADKIIKDRYGIVVEHISAMRGGVQDSYERFFYEKRIKGGHIGRLVGFPMQRRPWCNKLKTEEVDIRRYVLSTVQQGKEARRDIRIPDTERELVQLPKKRVIPESEVVQYLGIAVDEPIRIERHSKRKGIKLPLVDIGWTEAQAKQWCIENDLLSPIYTDTCLRGGCWFCHNQGVQQLRELRKNYPEYWKLLLKWDSDSPVSFHADGHTVHDFEKRFELEDKGLIKPNTQWRWDYLNELPPMQIGFFQDKEFR